MKYFLLLIVLVLIWRHWLKRGLERRKDSPPAAGKAAEKMLTCAVCHVYMPESEAILEAGRAFCCEAHRTAAAKAGEKQP